MTIWFDTVVVVGGVAAISLFDRVTSTDLTNPFQPGGAQVVSLNFVGNKDMRVGGSANACDETHGGMPAAPGGIDNIDGGFVIPPGGVIALLATTTPVAVSAASSILWEEIPILT